ncbi:MAG TPA: DUF4998 domain-containing protein [Puia sp.]|nr:DUF4998 domain-containing protein [Puia sp.]
MTPRQHFTLLLLPLCMALFITCTRTTGDAYKKYQAGGELVYPGRADTAIVRAGYKRIQLSIVLGNDPLVKKIRVYWNNQHDSLDITVSHTTGKDTVNVTIPNLAEGNYNFTVYSFDEEGHISVPCYGSGTVYGDSYFSSVVNRILRSVTQSQDGTQIILAWGGAAEGDIGTTVKYTGSDGTNHTITVKATEATTTLPSYQDGSLLTYQTFYKPDTTAFDLFFKDPGQVTLPVYERPLDKSKFAIMNLPTDVQDGGYGWLDHYLWDENYNPPGFATQSIIPCWFTIDAGEPATLSRLKVWQANDRLYDLESVKTFELYGSDNPNPDGSWASWTLIGSYTSVKPSGLPVGQNTQADIDYAKAGEEFTAPSGTPKFRYYRFKLLSNWGNSHFMTMEEITFYTHDRP